MTPTSTPPAYAADAAQRRGASGGVSREHERDEPEGNSATIASPASSPAAARATSCRVAVAPEEQDDERGEPERRGERVIEEERRERQQQGSGAEQDGGRRPEPGHTRSTARKISTSSASAGSTAPNRLTSQRRRV